MVKIAVCYTGLNPTVAGVTENSIKNVMGDKKYQLVTYSRPDAVAETQAAGELTDHAFALMAKSYFDAMWSGADIIYNVCSTIGDAPLMLKPIFRKFGVPLLQCDEEMMRQAVNTYERIALVATSETTMRPCVRLINECMKQEEKTPEITEVIVDSAFKKPMSVLREETVKAVKPIMDTIDCVVLTQASWYAAGLEISEDLGGFPVLSASEYGPQQLIREIEALGK